MLSRVIGRIKKIWQRRRSLSMALAGGALLNGCAALGTDSVKAPVTISEVIQMGKENVPADTVVNRMRESKAVYRLNATGLVRLHDQGVSDPVLDYMQQTYLDAVRREQVQADWNTSGNVARSLLVNKENEKRSAGAEHSRESAGRQGESYHVIQTVFGIGFRMRAYIGNQRMRSGGGSRGSSSCGVGNPTGAGESATAAATRGADRIVSRRTGRGSSGRVHLSH